MSFIRTILGDIGPDQLGICYAHEHIIIDPGYATRQYPEFLLDSVEVAVRELADFHRAGGRAMVDSMPCACGRNALKLAEISRRSQVHIVCPTGLHQEKYYAPAHWARDPAEDALVKLFVAEIEEGIIDGEHPDASSRRTPHRAGVIKITSDAQFSARAERIFFAAAQAHRETGCPILTHTEQGRLALEQIERLSRLGVNLRHVCLSHTDRQPDVVYHRDILASGVKVEFDSAFRWKTGQGNPTLHLILALIGDFPNQILLGMDAARRAYWRHYGGEPGLTWLWETFVSQLKANGLADALLERIFVANPAETFSFARR